MPNSQTRASPIQLFSDTILSTFIYGVFNLLQKAKPETLFKPLLRIVTFYTLNFFSRLYGESSGPE